ncbi:SRPBCC family protein [Mycolicibacterium flavescens]|uniref:Polyketide cyclase n=1 Tax=Mycolicibacterium flavescens TaxID=1776 RepID=A0A1E3RKR3_MYCFV|nr:SRPBCC family protein [Mycolicibacterium flavescens]MCV7278944.1 SRPBCC family protein [Mycolicibacterium flavescens]ODQ90449.1 polyketide cyclase [Mycolicibacterium flavescens]
MTDETLRTVRTINARPDTVFDVLADPSTHQDIDGTGWVREPLSGQRLTGVGQVFRMAMYHSNFGGMHYEVANRVEVFEPPHAIAWLPGQGEDDGELEFGGWFWRYDLEPIGEDTTRVTLTYDWSAVPATVRQEISFPPFAPDHLDNSLDHLARLVEDRAGVPR